jgi:NAD(P)H-hydrate epimerase
MKVATAEQMHELDRKAMETYHIPGILLMENAGRGAAEVMGEAFPDLQRRKIAIFSGKGNNGGDGFVVARHLLNRGIPAKVFLLTNPQVLRGDAETNFHIFKRMKGEIFSLHPPRNIRGQEGSQKYDLLIDGILEPASMLSKRILPGGDRSSQRTSETHRVP